MSNEEYSLLKSEVVHYYEMERYAQTLDRLDRLLSLSPNDSWALLIKANCLYMLDRYEEAKNDCRQALSLGHPSDYCNYLLGRIFTAVKQYPQAEECFLEALREAPQSAEIISAYAYLMTLAGEDKKAQSLIDEAFRLDPSNKTVLHYQFNIMVIRNKPKEMEAILKGYMTMSQGEMSKLVKIGITEYFSDHYKAAREVFRQAYLLDPTNEWLSFLLQLLDKQSSVLFLPHRLIDKIGGPAVMWIIGFGGAVVLNRMGFEVVSLVWAAVYILLCVYSWAVRLLKKRINRRR